MMRSLFAGVAGLKTHQTRMDIIGNNIAKHLYISFGFEETGKIEANMEELKYTFA